MRQRGQQQHATLEHKNDIELTGNPFVDTGLAVIAALNGCKTIEDLTLRKIKNVHGDGSGLARNNFRLKSSSMIFHDSLITNPVIRGREKEKLSQYAKITTAILQNIGNEEILERCEICGNPCSLDIDKLFRENIKDKKKKRDKNKKNSNKNSNKKQYIDRQWFPLVGSTGSDAQALPSGSRSLNVCAKCLFAVQYLPQGVILVRGLLAVFQSTSIEFWYNLVKEIVNDIRGKLQVSKTNKIDSIGYKQGSGVAVIDHLLPIMQRGIKFDPNTSLIMWLFSNFGSGADCEIYEIPNFTLSFLHKVVTHGLRNEIQGLIVKDKKTSFKYSFLNSISQRLDYYGLYPSKKLNNKGASSELFSLYQTHVLNYPINSLDTAYKIGKYVNSKILDTDSNDDNKQRKLAIDIHRDTKKQTQVKKHIVRMVHDGGITFDEYYDLFVNSGLGSNPWKLIKYYMLSNLKDLKKIESRVSAPHIEDQEKKNKIVYVGKAIFNSFIGRKGEGRFNRDVLGGLAHGRIHASWLRNQFEKLPERYDKNFDYNAYWNSLCINDRGEESVYELLYLFRLLWTDLIRDNQNKIENIGTIPT